MVLPRTTQGPASPVPPPEKVGTESRSPCPWSICHLLHLSELGHAGNGFESSPGTEGRRPPLSSIHQGQSSLPVHVAVLCSTGCRPHTHPGARKPTGRTDGAMETLGGTGIPQERTVGGAMSAEWEGRRLNMKLPPGPACQSSFVCHHLALWLRPMLSPILREQGQIRVVSLRIAFSCPTPGFKVLPSDHCCCRRRCSPLFHHT